ncbi:MAG: hypothetical protein R3C45_07125 [Phycisphaerales bacterium]
MAWVPGGAGLWHRRLPRWPSTVRVIVSDIALPDVAKDNADKLRGAGLRAEAMQIDIGNEQNVVSPGRTDRVPPPAIDVLVNMTYQHTKTRRKTSPPRDGTKRSVCLRGRLCRHARGRACDGPAGGSIIHFSSMYGLVSPDPRMYPPTQRMNPSTTASPRPAYSSIIIGPLCSPQQVRVNAIAPGPFPIPDTHGTDDQFMSRLCGKGPSGSGR